jgi:hypothetical protein
MQPLLHHTGRLREVPSQDAVVTTVGKPVGRFLLHLAEMCAVMCGSGFVLSVLFFEAAALLGFTELPQTAPEMSVLVIAINLSVPMAAWMRYRGMAWRPTLEMTVPTLATGVLLVVAYWLDLVAASSLIEIQTSLACPVMVAVMLLRFRLYSAPHTAHQPRPA